jgi:uncharacterized OB-fold protein
MSMDAMRCQHGHVTYPTHPLCPECGTDDLTVFDLSDRTGEVVTWTESTATPPGVREPNVLAIVEFDVRDASADAAEHPTDANGADESVRAIGQVADNAAVAVGDAVEPVYVDELREPGVGLKPAESDQDWDGYRFRPVED